MDLNQAIKEVSNIGLGYFYDLLDEYTPDEIIDQIINDILHTTKLQGLHYSEVTQDAFNIVLKNLQERELNDILENEYNLFPESVGGGRAFFQRIENSMDTAIREVKTKLER